MCSSGRSQYRLLLLLLLLLSHSVVSDSVPPHDCSLPGSSIHGIFQARVLEWVAIAFSDRLLGVLIKELYTFFYKHTFYVMWTFQIQKV